MRIKQSLILKKAEAKELSLRNKDTVYYVIDKKHCEALCYSITYFLAEKIKEGYHFVCSYKNGIKQF